MLASVSITRRIGRLARVGLAVLGLGAIFGAVGTADAASPPLAGLQVSGFAELLLPSGPTTAADDAALRTTLDA
jgi:hypothetical protein